MVMSDIRFGKIFRLPVKSVQINNIFRRQTPTSRPSFSHCLVVVDTINVRLSDSKIRSLPPSALFLCSIPIPYPELWIQMRQAVCLKLCLTWLRIKTDGSLCIKTKLPFLIWMIIELSDLRAAYKLFFNFKQILLHYFSFFQTSMKNRVDIC